MDRMRAGLTGLGLVFVATLAASVMFVPDASPSAERAGEANEPLAQLGVAPGSEKPDRQAAPPATMPDATSSVPAMPPDGADAGGARPAPRDYPNAEVDTARTPKLTPESHAKPAPDPSKGATVDASGTLI